jgi:hypothetical protein
MESWRAPMLRVKNTEGGIALRSNAANLFTFAFDIADYAQPRSSAVTCSATGGRADGIVQWLELAMDDTGTYENAPDTSHYSCWAMYFHPFAKPIETRDGDTLTIAGAHDRHHVRVWLGK